MKRIFNILLLLVILASTASTAHADDISLPSVRKNFVAKWGYSVSQAGDTVYKVILNTIVVYPSEKFKNDAEKE